MDREELRRARLARLEGLESRSPSSPLPVSEDGTLKRDDIKEIERILVLEWCDERHNSASTLVTRAKRLIKVISNALTDEKCRSLRYENRRALSRSLDGFLPFAIRAHPFSRFNNPSVQRLILSCPPSEKLLRAVGWTSRVDKNERVLVWDHDSGSKEARLSNRLIERLKEVEKKEQRRLDQKERLKADEQARLQRARSMLEDDHEQRKEKHQRRLLIQPDEDERGDKDRRNTSSGNLGPHGV